MNDTQMPNTMFQTGQFYANDKAVLMGMAASFKVVSRTKKTLTIQTSQFTSGQNVKIRTNSKGVEWVKLTPSPYSPAIYAG